MAVTRQLYQLQELDNNIESDEQTLAAKTNQLGKRLELDIALERLTAAREKLKQLNHQRRDAEGALDDVLSKVSSAEGQLYGGKITNPKELSNLQHEVNTLKSHSDQLETRALEIIDQVEEEEKNVAAQSEEYKKLEEEWNVRQKRLGEEIERRKASLAGLKQQRQELAGQIDGAALSLYEKIRQQKRPAVSKVEQGICHACHISLSAAVLQKARSGQPVLCGTCGRILFIS